MIKGKRGFTDFGAKILKDEVFTHSAALAYYATLAFAPLIILTVSTLTLLDLNMQDQLVEQVRALVGHEAAQLLKVIIEGAQSRADLASTTGIISAIFLIFSASVIFAQLQSALNIIFEVETFETQEESFFSSGIEFLKVRILSFGMVFTFIFMIIVSLIASAAISFIFQTANSSYVEWLQFSVNLFVFSILFALILRVLPDKFISYKRAFAGGLIIAILFIFGKFLIGIYIGQTAVGSAYGAAGSLAALLVWFYYSSLIIFIGAEISSNLYIINE